MKNDEEKTSSKEFIEPGVIPVIFVQNFEIVDILKGHCLGGAAIFVEADSFDDDAGFDEFLRVSDVFSSGFVLGKDFVCNEIILALCACDRGVELFYQLVVRLSIIGLESVKEDVLKALIVEFAFFNEVRPIALNQGRCVVCSLSSGFLRE